MSAEAYELRADRLGWPADEPMLDRLHRWAELEPDRTCLERLHVAPWGQMEAVPFTAPALLAGAGRAAGALRAAGVGEGDRVVLCLPNREEFVHAFLGAQWLGAYPVPLPSIHAMGASATLLERARGVVVSCAPAALMADAATLSGLSVLDVDELRGLPLLDAAALEGEAPPRRRARPEEPAYLQYTSGSTAAPRGVVVTHRNAAANVAAISKQGRLEEGDRFLSWLPAYHDMGLVGMLLQPLYNGSRLLWMSTEDFRSRPPVWLKAMSAFGATISGAPNFAYRLCLRIAGDRVLEGLDLRRWRAALCGGEQVNPATMRAFLEKFAPCGLRPTALFPVYGLAEATLSVTFPEPGAPMSVDRVDRRALADGRAVPAAPEAPAAELVGLGRELTGHRVRICHPETGVELEERRTGEVVFSGPSVTAGYHGEPPRPPGSALRTGDLGYLAGGQLYVVDRIKDLIIVGGRNVSPSDVERTAQVEGVRMGRAAALGVPDPEQGTEALVVLVEPETRNPEGLEGPAALRARIDRAVQEGHGLAPREVLVLPAGTLERTSSGKLMRRRMRDRYLSGELAPLALG